MVKINAIAPEVPEPQGGWGDKCWPKDHHLDFDVPVKTVTKAWADCPRFCDLKSIA